MSFSKAKLSRFNDVTPGLSIPGRTGTSNASGKQLADGKSKVIEKCSKLVENYSRIEKSKDNKLLHIRPKVMLKQIHHITDNSKKIPCVEGICKNNEIMVMEQYETPAEFHQTISECLVDTHRNLHLTYNSNEVVNTLWKYLRTYISCFDELLSVLDDCLQESESSESQLDKFSSFIDKVIEYKLDNEGKICDSCKQCCRCKEIAKNAKSVTTLLTDRLMKADEQVSELHKKIEQLTRETNSEDIANVMIGDIKETKTCFINMIDILKEEFSRERAKFSVILNDKENMIASLIKRMYSYEMRVQEATVEIAHLKSNDKLNENNCVLCSNNDNCSIINTAIRIDCEKKSPKIRTDSDQDVERLTERIIQLEQQLVNTKEELSCFQNKYREKCDEYAKTRPIGAMSNDVLERCNNASCIVRNESSISQVNRNMNELDISQPKLKQIENISQVHHKTLLPMANTSYQLNSKEAKRKHHKPTGKENATEDCSLRNLSVF